MFTSIIHTQEDIHRHQFGANDSERKPFHIEDDGRSRSSSRIGSGITWIKFFLVSLGTHNGEPVLLNHKREKRIRKKEGGKIGNFIDIFWSFAS